VGGELTCNRFRTLRFPFAFTSGSFAFHLDVTSIPCVCVFCVLVPLVSLCSHFGATCFTSVSFELHLDATPSSLRNRKRTQFDVISILLWSNFVFTLSYIRAHLYFTSFSTSTSLRTHFELTLSSLRFRFDVNSVSFQVNIESTFNYCCSLRFHFGYTTPSL